MKKTKLTRSLMAACSIVALSAVMYGCVHDGGSDDPPTTVDMDVMEPTMPEREPTPVDVTIPSLPMDEMYALSAATHTIAPGGMAENGGVSFMCAADGEACVVTVAADGTAMSTGGDVTASLTAAAKMAYDAEKADEMAEMDGRAAGLSSALTDATGTRGEPIRVDTPLKNVDFMISRGLSGMAMVSDGGKSGWSTSPAPNALAGWQGTVLDNGATQTYTVYTDIAAATRKSFLVEYPNTRTDIAGATVTIADGVVTLDATAMTAAANAGLLDPTGFPQPEDPGEGTNMFTYDGTTGNKANMFPGTFHGASGTYVCGAPGALATDCTASVTAPSTFDGPRYTVAGSWTFTADVNNNPQVIAQDADHMHFGWWLNTPKAAGVGGEYLYDAQVYFGGSTAFPDANIAALEGNASYTGPAAGLYAVTANAATNTAAAFGEFTATAMLTAAFGDGTARGSVSGTIGSFMRDDGMANDWELSLGMAALDAAAGTGSGNIVDGIDQIGGWNYQLFGSGGGGANPTGIAGAFDATIGTAALAGAFATKPQ